MRLNPSTSWTKSSPAFRTTSSIQREHSRNVQKGRRKSAFFFSKLQLGANEVKLKLPVIIPVGAGHVRDSLTYAIQIFPSKLSFARLYPACRLNRAHRDFDCTITTIMTVFTACLSGADFVACAAHK